MNLKRKDKQYWQELTIKEGFARWSKLYKESENDLLFLSPQWIKTYEDDPSIKIILISKGGLDIAAILLTQKGIPPFRMKLSGPIIKKNIQNLKPSKILSYEKAILEQIAEIIIKKNNFYYWGAWNYKFKYWYPLKWKGFKQSTGYHFITQIDNKEKCWNNLETKIRTDIRKAIKYNLIIKKEKIEDFLFLLKKKKPKDYERISKFYIKLDKEINLEVKTTYQKNNPISSILYVIYSDTIYYLDAINNDKLLGSQSFNLWKLIEQSDVMYLNFLGSQIPNVEKFFRGFGGRPKSFYIISRINFFSKLFIIIRNLMKKIYSI